MAKVLTQAAVEKLKAAKKRRHIPDGGMPGLYLIIQPTGAKSWAIWYRIGGTQHKMTIGSFPAFGLKEAREAASAALRKASEGKDPAVEKAQTKQEAREGRDLFATVAETFLTRHVKKKNGEPIGDIWKAERRRLLDKEVLPSWGRRRIQDITKRDVIGLLDSIVDRGSGKTANRTLAVIRKLFAWAVSRDVLDASPCAGVEAPTAERPRDRILSDDELRWLWRVTEKDGYPFGSAVRLLLLTGLRRSEVGKMTAGELLADTWTIPATRTKNNKAHTVPLSRAVLEVLENLPRVRNEQGYLLCTNGRTPASGYSRAKIRIDAAMLEEARKGDKKINIPHWTYHDLRRTVASGMAGLGVALPVIEKVLNHTSGSFGGIVSVYQHYDFAKEKRHALEKWGRHIESLVKEREPAKVVSFPGAAS